MRTLKRLFLSVLTMLPIASISTVAYSQVNELAGEGQTDLLRSQIREARHLLFEKGVITTSIKEARERLADEAGIQDEQVLEAELNRLVQLLLDNGLIEVNEVSMRSAAPSVW